MKYTYKYNDVFTTLEKVDEFGVIIATMQMPKTDLYKIVKLSYEIGYNEIMKYEKNSKNTLTNHVF